MYSPSKCTGSRLTSQKVILTRTSTSISLDVIYYLTRARSEPMSDPVKPLIAGCPEGAQEYNSLEWGGDAVSRGVHLRYSIAPSGWLNGWVGGWMGGFVHATVNSLPDPVCPLEYRVR